MTEKGFFIITDITGYTSFLSKKELDHAEHIIEALFNSQLNVIKSPVNISNFQGDAILCYATEPDIVKGMTLIEQVKLIYDAFTGQIAAMQVDPPCSCKACANIGDLDLKIFIHFGSFILKKMGDRQELMGSDVILAHRMMKNDVREKTGIHSYLLITENALNQLKLEKTDFNLIDYSESYEHIGEVKMKVASLNEIQKININ